MVMKKTPDEWAKLVRDEHKQAQINYPKLVLVHGSKDMIVNISNSYELVKQWTALHKTDTVYDRNIEKFDGNSNVQKLVYQNQNKQNVVTFYKINHLGHAISVDPGKGPKTRREKQVCLLLIWIFLAHGILLRNLGWFGEILI
jgi:poly(3-hydroxybutyrate) depolymerase